MYILYILYNSVYFIFLSSFVVYMDLNVELSSTKDTFIKCITKRKPSTETKSILINQHFETYKYIEEGKWIKKSKKKWIKNVKWIKNNLVHYYLDILCNINLNQNSFINPLITPTINYSFHDRNYHKNDNPILPLYNYGYYCECNLNTQNSNNSIFKRNIPSLQVLCFLLLKTTYQTQRGINILIF